MEIKNKLKSWWQGLEYWKKGGIIGVVIGIIFLLGAYLYQWWVGYTKPDFSIARLVIEKPNVIEILMVSPFLVASFILFLIIGAEAPNSLTPVVILLGLVIYFLIGALIGMIIGKIKGKNKK